MRLKTEAKREAILEAASTLFLKFGYERTSMSQISEQVGGSKATLYSYFPSKEILFVDVILQAGRHEFGPAIALLEVDTGHDLSTTLQRFGIALLTAACKPESVAWRRMAIASAGTTNIGRRFYEAGPEQGETRVASFLKSAMNAGRLRDADARVAARQLLALLEAEPVNRFLMGLPLRSGAADIQRWAVKAVATFMAAYQRPETPAAAAH